MSILSRLNNKYLRGEIIFAADTILSFAASVVALVCVRSLLDSSFISSRFIVLYLATSIIASVVLFLITRSFQIIIRHFSVKDTIPFAEVLLGKSLALFVALTIAGFYSKYLLLLVVFDLLVTGTFLFGIRLSMILAYEFINRKQTAQFNQQQILVYGTSDKSVAVLKRLQNSPHYHINGFLERNTNENKYLLDLLPVYQFKDDKKLNHIILDKKIDAVLFSRSIDAQAEGEGLIPFCSKHKVKTLIVPGVDEVAEGHPLIHPREIKVEDLLWRKEISISLDEIKTFFIGKVVMVTGAAGSIGSELVRQLAVFGVKKLILFDNGETAMHNLRLELEDNYKDLDFVPVIGDVRHPDRLDYVFRSWHPQVVFHAAAYKHVPLMEENPCEAVLVNLYGTKNVADKCLEYDVEKMVMISTDKAVNPTNIMGCTKRLAEIYVQSLGLAIEKGEKQGRTLFVTTRFGNVLGSNGSVIPRFREQIAAGGPVTVTHPEINRFFMTIPEACRLVLEAATMSSSTQIFVFDMGQPVKIDQLARRMISLAGFTPDKDIKIVYTGLRPGEKLYEEVLSNEENTLPAFHERIRIAKVREYEYENAEKITEELEFLARKVRIPEMVRLMKNTVPEFKSENSLYKKYDN